jgi:uncharacterized 2Fe-2S/4Fe-4S cluster protein (DUF4445 family)
MATEHPIWGDRLGTDENGMRRFLITDQGTSPGQADSGETSPPVSLYLTQGDIRELQKAKGAVRAAIDILMARLDLQPDDLQRLILTGSFGSQVDVASVAELGMVPPVDLDVIEPSANGAGFGAAMFLNDEAFARGERIAARAEQIDLDQNADFINRYVESMELSGGRHN